MHAEKIIQRASLIDVREESTVPKPLYTIVYRAPCLISKSSYVDANVSNPGLEDDQGISIKKRDCVAYLFDNIIYEVRGSEFIALKVIRAHR